MKMQYEEQGYEFHKKLYAKTSEGYYYIIIQK